MSSAYGLEERVPSMDHRLVIFTLSLSKNYKLQFWNEKYILKKIFGQILPKKITKRRKGGYNMPMDYWFRNILNNTLIDLLDSNNHDIYRKNYILDLLKRLNKSGNNYKKNFYISQKLWTIYVFEEWYNRFMT